MLFKFASYLLGTNNEESKPDQEQQLNIESNENQDTQPDTQANSSTDLIKEEKEILTDEVNSNKQEDLIEDEYMYDEQLINCSKLKNSNSNLQSDLNKEDQLCDQLEDDDYEDEQWIYITPIKRKNEEEKEISEDEFKNEEEKESILIDEKDASKENVPNQENQNANKEEFNFYDYFNNKSFLTTLNEECCSPVKSSKLDASSTVTKKPTANKKKLNHHHKLQQMNRMEQSWNFLPPACFQFENTFVIEEHPLENLLLENPALSVIASTEKDSNASSLTNSSSLICSKNRILVDRNLNNQTKKEASATSRKQMRKRANSSRKSNKKQNDKKNKSPAKKSDVSTSENVSPASSPIKTLPAEKVEKEASNVEEKQVLGEKQLLAHFLASNSIASSNGSTHQSPTTTHPHLHFITSNSSVATSTNPSVENKKGSKSLRRETKRNNKVALKRENLSNKPFTLHRKLC